MASASSVAEASSEVSAMAVTMPEDKGRSNFNHQRFITLAEKEITLTAWKHDNARLHTERVAMNCIAACQILPSPAILPNLSPIEPVWM
ncbi:hypothetical protein TNCV_4364211 [Trichonephila clavipes]|nr:hypothetical protein TNCV_4364211 [Trichonephila clavipes]